MESLQIKSKPTKRAPDAGDSAQISGSFLRLSIFLAGRLRRPRPSAGTYRAIQKLLGGNAVIIILAIEVKARMKQKLSSQPTRANKLALRFRIDTTFSLTLNNILLGVG